MLLWYYLTVPEINAACKFKKKFQSWALIITLEKILINHNAIILPARLHLLGQIDWLNILIALTFQFWMLN